MPGVALHHPRDGNPSSDPVGRSAQEHLMLDVLMLALGLGFFVAAVGYTYACERL
jgi:hypothetical protein